MAIAVAHRDAADTARGEPPARAGELLAADFEEVGGSGRRRARADVLRWLRQRSRSIW